MIDELRIALRSALRDLDQGLGALIGGPQARLTLARELLERDGGGPARPGEPVAPGRRPDAPRPARRRVRSRRSSAPLALVR